MFVKKFQKWHKRILEIDIEGEALFKAVPSVGITSTPFSFAPKEAFAKPKTSDPKASMVLENVKPSATKSSATKTGTKALTTDKPQHTTSKTSPSAKPKSQLAYHIKLL